MMYGDFLSFGGWQGNFALFGLAALWTLVWKGLALWRAAENRSKVWFVVFLIVNTLGILEIVYFFFLSKPNHHKMHAGTVANMNPESPVATEVSAPNDSARSA